jgi:hypothetical protein
VDLALGWNGLGPGAGAGMRPIRLILCGSATRRVVHEDPRIRDTAAYSSVLAAVAAGESSPTKIGGLLGTRPRTAGAPVAFIGEAKHRDRRPGLAELRNLAHRRELLTAAGHDASNAVLGLFSATGFTEELQAEATDSRGKILLASLEMLYGQPTITDKGQRLRAAEPTR